MQGGAEFARLDLEVSGQSRVYTHPIDKTVDIAVVPALPDQKEFNFKCLPDAFLTTKESFSKLNISEGSDVFFTGLFTPHYGQHANYPIARFGRVAMFPNERIYWKEANKDPEMLELYLIETQSFGGNSGSPVFFYLCSDRLRGSLVLGPPELKLAGVMKGSFVAGSPVVEVAAKNAVALQNMGIAAVVPSYLLHEILFSEELRRQRAANP